MVTIVELHAGKGDLCRRILDALPQWFGIPEAVDQYVAGVEALPMYVARSDGEDVGFVSLKAHTPAAAEVYVTGVLPSPHRRGGRAHAVCCGGAGGAPARCEISHRQDARSRPP